MQSCFSHVALPLVAVEPTQLNLSLKAYPHVNITVWLWEFSEKAPLLEATFVLITGSLRETCFLLTLESMQTRDK